MDELARQFIYTLGLRPYFFIFFLVYLVGCSFDIGALRTLVFTLGGFVVAWAAEHLSIHVGFPFGRYFYTELTKGSELWVWDVPFIDSMSFVFLAWASYKTALLALCPVAFTPYRIDVRVEEKVRHPWAVRITSVLFFVLLDIIIDPVALRGNRWFLGSLYYYPEPGIYFGVPLANFGGWLLVGLALIWLLQLLDREPDKRNMPTRKGYVFRWGRGIGPALYLAVFGFNLFMAFFIGEYLMGLTAVLLLTLLLGFVAWSVLFHLGGIETGDLKTEPDGLLFRFQYAFKKSEKNIE